MVTKTTYQCVCTYISGIMTSHLLIAQASASFNACTTPTFKTEVLHLITNETTLTVKLTVLLTQH